MPDSDSAWSDQGERDEGPEELAQHRPGLPGGPSAWGPRYDMEGPDASLQRSKDDLASLGPSFAARAAVAAGPSEKDSGPDAEVASREVGRSLDIVHETLKSTDVTLGYKFSEIEKEADRLAADWAHLGLPRHDVPRTELTEPEKLLAGRAQEGFSAWTRAVKRKMLGALDGELQEASDAIASGERALKLHDEAARKLNELLPRHAEPAAAEDVPGVAAADEGLVEDPVPLGSESPSAGVVVAKSTLAVAHEEPRRLSVATRKLPWYFMAPLLVLLIAAEFVANAPVFTELFPADRVVDAEVAEWIATNAPAIEGYGLRSVWLRTWVYVEPALLAFSVVAFFLYLGHVLGESLRAFIALGTVVQPRFAGLARERRRQSFPPLMLTTLAVGLTVVVLGVARHRIPRMAEERFDRAEATLVERVAEEASAETKPEDREGIRRARLARLEAIDERNHRQDRLDYAQSISALNMPITLLNLVLVTVAIVIGYHRQKVELELAPLSDAAPPLAALAGPDEKSDSPSVEDSLEPTEAAVVMQERIAGLREQLNAGREELRQALARARTRLHGAQRLAQAEPFADWRGVAARMERTIVRFRHHNASLRRLDPVHIAAFAVPPAIDIKEPVYSPGEERLGRKRDLEFRAASLSSAYEQLSAPGRRKPTRRQNDESAGSRQTELATASVPGNGGA